MDLHSGASGCPASRALLITRVQSGSTVTRAAAVVGGRAPILRISSLREQGHST